MSIPVIGTAVVNSSYWVARLLMSVDYPVDNFFIVDNNGRGEIKDELDNLCNIKHKFIKNIQVCHMPSNIGVAASWNLIIKCYMLSPYWIIVNDDVSFGSGLLKEMYDTAKSDPVIGMIHAHPGDFELGSWDLFLMRDHIVQNFGLFDENLYPAYCEDVDYFMRFIHRPIKKVTKLNSTYYHGFGTTKNYANEGSQTSRTDPSLKDKLNKCNKINMEYLSEKWGEGWRVCDPHKDPNNTFYDLEFIRKKNLGF